MFGFFKKKKEVEPEFNFSSIGVDMHSHIIPGIDDGAQNVNDSIVLAQKFKSLGFSKLVATPHVIADFYRNTPDTINRGLDVLRKGLQDANIDLEVHAAAEYYFDETLEKKVRNKEILTLGKDYMLFELSFANEHINLFDFIKIIQDAGYKPVLAHPERYGYYHNSMENYEKIRATGCALQLNSISLTGYYGSPVKKIAEEMVDNLLIDFIGSDMHHPKHAAALKDVLNTQSMKTLLTERELLNKTLL